MGFQEVIESITKRGVEWHRETIIANTFRNAERITKSFKDISPDTRPAIVISAGPSLYRQNILKRLWGRFAGTIIATDGAYIQCLRNGVIPDYVVTLDPHPTRVVRWFGDPDLARNAEGDDYFARQDLDVEFRTNAEAKNARNIELVNEQAYRSKFVVSTTSPENVVQRLSGKTELYWFVPLVDDPQRAWSTTARMVRDAEVSAMNTGGTVGTAAWVFAHSILRSSLIAVVGMDFGYPLGTPLEKTQSWHMLDGDASMYPTERGYWGEAFTDPTYYWYRRNLLDLLKANKARIINCSGEGLLYGPGVGCMDLEQWLNLAI